MIDILFMQVKIFVFIFAILVIIRDLFNLIKVIRLKEGKFELTRTGLISLGCSISYVLTMLISGF